MRYLRTEIRAPVQIMLYKNNQRKVLPTYFIRIIVHVYWNNIWVLAFAGHARISVLPLSCEQVSVKTILIQFKLPNESDEATNGQ